LRGINILTKDGSERGMRPSWDSYFVEITKVVATRSTCLRRKVGAIIVKDKHIITTGYNGAPSALPHCADTGCMRDKLQIPSGERHELCLGLHAEQNAIIQASVHGVSVVGGTLYVTSQPCILCSKMLINAGIKRIVFVGPYPDTLALSLLKTAGIELTPWGEEEK